MRFDYTTVGHVTVDVMADGSRRPGGSAFYSALQAARLGLRARVITRGVAPSEIEELLGALRGELELETAAVAADDDARRRPASATRARSGCSRGRDRSTST